MRSHEPEPESVSDEQTLAQRAPMHAAGQNMPSYASFYTNLFIMHCFSLFLFLLCET